MACTHSKDLDQAGHPPSLISICWPLEEAWVLSYRVSAQRRLIRLGGYLDCSVFTGRTCHFVRFVMRWLISYFLVLELAGLQVLVRELDLQVEVSGCCCRERVWGYPAVAMEWCLDLEQVSEQYMGTLVFCSKHRRDLGPLCKMMEHLDIVHIWKYN